jgi:flagellar hook-basal body complex protein FliE
MGGIGFLIHKLGEKNLIAKIGMPIEWGSRKKNLMMYIQAHSEDGSLEIAKIIRESPLNYNVLIVDVTKKKEKKKKIITDEPKSMAPKKVKFEKKKIEKRLMMQNKMVHKNSHAPFQSMQKNNNKLLKKATKFADSNVKKSSKESENGILGIPNLELADIIVDILLGIFVGWFIKHHV